MLGFTDKRSRFEMRTTVVIIVCSLFRKNWGMEGTSFGGIVSKRGGSFKEGVGK